MLHKTKRKRNKIKVYTMVVGISCDWMIIDVIYYLLLRLHEQLMMFDVVALVLSFLHSHDYLVVLVLVIRFGYLYW